MFILVEMINIFTLIVFCLVKKVITRGHSFFESKVIGFKWSFFYILDDNSKAITIKYKNSKEIQTITK